MHVNLAERNLTHWNRSVLLKVNNHNTCKLDEQELAVLGKFNEIL